MTVRLEASHERWAEWTIDVGLVLSAVGVGAALWRLFTVGTCPDQAGLFGGAILPCKFEDVRDSSSIVWRSISHNVKGMSAIDSTRCMPAS
jgi:hypothetical protein